ncbi:MAG: DUF3105 domain-containing protein [Chloroflexi bacterium]|nr:DUF3105 domain-containing protein [Chloroflexota bacterium]
MAQQESSKRQGSRRSVARAGRRARHQTRKRARRATYLLVSGFIGALIIISLFIPSFTGTGRSGSIDEDPFQVLAEGTDYFGYSTSPPTFGPSWPTGAEWGIHTEDIRDERQVRNLMEGGVLLQYNTEDQETIGTLVEVVERQGQYPCYLIVAPYAAIESTVAMTAWGAVETMEEVDGERIQQFIDTYRGAGPQTPPCVLQEG